jgi:uncharacterized protein
LNFIYQFVHLFVEAAPFLLFGMFIAGLIQQFIPTDWVANNLSSKSSVVYAAFIGAPLPLCSCSVIPVAMSIHQKGASKASTASFLVSTPETGIDSIGITYALMGPVMAIARPIAAITSAIAAGGLIAWLSPSKEAAKQSATVTHSCCHVEEKTERTTVAFTEKLKKAVSYGYGQLLDDFMTWLLIGLFFAALVAAYAPPDLLSQYGSSVWTMLLVVLLSVPMYICATASTPVAVGLLMAGVSPGAALVFMLTGPATNIATLMVILKELGKRELALYLLAVVSVAVASGVLLDYLFDLFQWQLQLTNVPHEGMTGLIYNGSALILATLMLARFYKKWRPKKTSCCAH